MRFDPTLISHAWQSVAAATGTDKTDRGKYRAVTLETHDTGVFIAGSDDNVVLHAWIPNRQHTVYDPAPSLDTAPSEVVTICDPSHRALSLITYVGKQAEDDDIDPDDYLVDITIGRRKGDGSFPGLEAHTVTFAAAGETVTLDTWDGAPYPWRQIQHDALQSVATTETSLSPGQLTKLVKAAKPHGDLVAISASFGGLNKPILVEIVNSEPYISGVVMPRRIEAAIDVEVA